MLKPHPHRILPAIDELIHTDDTPVDNEKQNLIPNFLLSTLLILWGHRLDWYLGVDMAIFHPYKDNPKDPIVPDAFLALGVERQPDPAGRLSYRVWDEDQVPQFVLEMVSQTYNDEFGEKMNEYARMGVRYYAIYIPPPLKRKGHDAFEVYRLEGSEYVRMSGDPVWLEEIGLGIGTGSLQLGQVTYDCLLWYDEEGDPYYPPELEVEKLARQLERSEHRWLQAEQQRLQAEQQRLQAEEQQRQAEQQRLQAEEQQRQAEQQRLQAEEQQRQAEQQRLQAEQQRLQAEEKQRQAEQQRLQAEQQQRQAEEQRLQAEEQQRQAEQQRLQAEQQLQQEQQVTQKLKNYLRSLGLDPDTLDS